MDKSELKKLLLCYSNILIMSSYDHARRKTFSACGLHYLTSDITGVTDTPTTTPKRCTPATVATACSGNARTGNARCLFSLKHYSYICCFSITNGKNPSGVPDTRQELFYPSATTVATLAPGNTVAPQNMQPGTTFSRK